MPQKDKGNKQQRQEMEDERDGEGTSERRKGYLSWRDRGLSLDREETGMALRQMATYKGKRRTRMLE